jgi:hypothetical protein
MVVMIVTIVMASDPGHCLVNREATVNLLVLRAMKENV